MAANTRNLPAPDEALRQGGHCDGRSPPRPGRLELDFDARRAIVDGESLRLSIRETQLLRILYEAGSAVVSYERIIESIWGRGVDADFMNLRVLAWQVRRKIESNPALPRFLITEASEGYRLKLD
jgi:two-component system, OmpR family, KDP operon response regulator KdpE